MSARLHLELGDGSGRSIELPRRGRWIVGSSRERADTVLDDLAVAAVHCAIGRLKGGGWALKDLGSETGTRVNGRRVASTRLEPGDEIALGGQRLRVVDPDAPAPRRDAAERAAPMPSIPGYRLERPLGRGSTGHVYLAVQESLDRLVALKVLDPEHASDGDFVGRFQAEARAAAALNHPNVVTVYDVGEAGGHHFLSMEYMEGGCLESRVSASGPLPADEVVAVLRDAASGLVYAQSRGIVHRDLKPANLMRGQHGTTKIADLGLAAQIHGEEVQEGGRKVFGTPHFIAPEVVRGAKPDARSDLYSLGATAYRLLSGRTPFDGTSPKEILLAALTAEPTPLRERAPGVPRALADLVERLLHKEPDDRPPTAAALASELGALAASAGPAGHGARRTVALFAVLLAALAAGLAWWRPWERLPPRGAEAAAPSASRGRSLSAPEDALAFAEPEPAASPAPPPEDGDAALELLETRAELALLKLREHDLGPDELASELRRFAGAFPGTDAAATAEREAAAIDARLRAEADERRARDERVGGRLAELSAALPPDPAARPGHALATLASVPGQGELAGVAAFEDGRAALVREVVQAASARARAELARADASAEKGDFEAYRDALTDLVEALALDELEALAPSVDEPEGGPSEEGVEDPDAPAETEARDADPVADADEPSDGRGSELSPGEGGEDTPETDEPAPAPATAFLPDEEQLAPLRELRATARERLASIEERRAAYQRRARDADRKAIAATAYGPANLEGELRAGDLGEAAARLDRLAAELVRDESRQPIEALRDELLLGQRAFAALGRGFASPGWRRVTVTDPRTRSTVDAVGADATGVTARGDGGTEHLPWTLWAGRSVELNRLFHERLARDWTVEESRGVAALLLVAAALETLDGVRAELAGEPRRGEPPAPETWLEPYAAVEPWAAAGDCLAWLARERRAAARLGQALQAERRGALSLAIVTLERVLDEDRDALVALLLSDGSDWRTDERD